MGREEYLVYKWYMVTFAGRYLYPVVVNFTVRDKGAFRHVIIIIRSSGYASSTTEYGETTGLCSLVRCGDSRVFG